MIYTTKPPYHFTSMNYNTNYTNSSVDHNMDHSNRSVDYHFSRPQDYIFGTVQALISSTGCILNFLSFAYFTTLQTRNPNRHFFQRLYVIITLNDLLISLLMLLVVDAAFSKERAGVLAASTVLCSGWAVLWSFLPQVSVFLVGMLSVSRLYVLRYPTRQLSPYVAWAVPASCVIVMVTVSIALLLSGFMYTFYHAELFSCWFHNIKPDDQDIKNITKVEMKHGLIHYSLYNLIPAALIFPISVSCLLSLRYLHKSSQIAAHVRVSCTRQREATKTVVIVTLLYIVCNIPYVVAIGQVMSRHVQTMHHGEMTVRKYLDEFMLNKADGYKFTNSLMGALMTISLVSLNSMVNPVLYFWRIKHFRSNVFKVWRWGSGTTRHTSHTRKHTTTTKTITTKKHSMCGGGLFKDCSTSTLTRETDM